LLKIEVGQLVTGYRLSMNKDPWPFRVLVWYYKQPLLGYGVLCIIALCWGLLPRTGEDVVLAVLVAPWLFPLLILLNLPFVGGLIMRLRLHPAERRNHALEHGTIHCFLRRHGMKKKVGGEAESEGFRVSGIGSSKEIREAFSEFLALDQSERLSTAVSNRCGSMLVIAQGIGVILLLSAFAVFTFLPLSSSAVALLLGAQFLFYLALRRPLGCHLQRHRLLSFDFEEATILDIKQVERIPPFEKGPVFFVRTHVR